MAKRYPEQEIENALVAAATLGIRPAARKTGIAHSTIQGWIEQRTEHYAELRTTVAAKIREQAAATWEDHAQELLRVQADLVNDFDTKREDLEAKDLPNAIKAVNIAAGIATDKANALRDRPTSVVRHEYDLPMIEALIREREQIIEGEAVELDPPAELAQG